MPSRPEAALTMDDAVVVLGVLRLIEDVVPPELRSISERVVDRVERRLGGAGAAPAFQSLSTMEAETQRLFGVLRTALSDVEVIVRLLETVTSPGDRPVVLTTTNEAVLRSLTERVARLNPVPRNSDRDSGG